MECDCHNCKRTEEFKPYLYMACLNKTPEAPLLIVEEIGYKFGDPKPEDVHPWGFKQIRDEQGNFLAWDASNGRCMNGFMNFRKNKYEL